MDQELGAAEEDGQTDHDPERGLARRHGIGKFVSDLWRDLLGVAAANAVEDHPAHHEREAGEKDAAIQAPEGPIQ